MLDILYVALSFNTHYYRIARNWFPFFCSQAFKQYNWQTNNHFKMYTHFIIKKKEEVRRKQLLSSHLESACVIWLPTFCEYTLLFLIATEFLSTRPRTSLLNNMLWWRYTKVNIKKKSIQTVRISLKKVFAPSFFHFYGSTKKNNSNESGKTSYKKYNIQKKYPNLMCCYVSGIGFCIHNANASAFNLNELFFVLLLLSLMPLSSSPSSSSSLPLMLVLLSIQAHIKLFLLYGHDLCVAGYVKWRIHYTHIQYTHNAYMIYHEEKLFMHEIWAFFRLELIFIFSYAIFFSFDIHSLSFSHSHSNIYTNIFNIA